MPRLEYEDVVAAVQPYLGKPLPAYRVVNEPAEYAVLPLGAVVMLVNTTHGNGRTNPVLKDIGVVTYVPENIDDPEWYEVHWYMNNEVNSYRGSELAILPDPNPKLAPYLGGV